jgi:hypothetical protein
MLLSGFITAQFFPGTFIVEMQQLGVCLTLDFQTRLNSAEQSRRLQVVSEQGIVCDGNCFTYSFAFSIGTANLRCKDESRGLSAA